MTGAPFPPLPPLFFRGQLLRGRESPSPARLRRSTSLGGGKGENGLHRFTSPFFARRLAVGGRRVRAGDSFIARNGSATGSGFAAADGFAVSAPLVVALLLHFIASPAGLRPPSWGRQGARGKTACAGRSQAGERSDGTRRRRYFKTQRRALMPKANRQNKKPLPVFINKQEAVSSSDPMNRTSTWPRKIRLHARAVYPG